MLQEEENWVINESEIEPGMKIVKDYKKGQTTLQVKFQTCPKCSRQIPESEWKQHLKIELLDQKWREAKEDSLWNKWVGV